MAERVWRKTPKPNLFKHGPSGTFYVRVRVGRKNAHRESLGTKEYPVAVARLQTRIDELMETRRPKKGEAPATIWDALRIVAAQVEDDPTLKERSRQAYAAVIKSLGPGFDGVPVPITPLLKLSAEEMETWWRQTAAHYAPARANYQLLFVRRALATARERKAISANVTKTLKRVAVPRTVLNVPSREKFAELVKAVSEQPWAGKEAAQWIEFVSYTGMRPEEANSVEWEHVDRAKNVVKVTGGPTGTKNGEIRHVPINPQLADLLERIQARTGATAGRILTTRNPVRLIRRGCEAVGIEPMTRYDFRHLFATRCVESGIDAPTLAIWLGHKDGGALALRVYVHPTTDHEHRSAARVRF